MTFFRSRLSLVYPLILTILLLALSSPGHAQVVTLIEDLVNGAVISETCSSCHGKDGMGYPEGTPRLAGQSAKYLVRQLFQLRQTARERQGIALGFDNAQATMTGTSKMRSSARSFEGMDDSVTFLDDQDIVDVAAYYRSLSCKPAQKPRLEVPVAATRCRICHGPSGNKTSATVPNIASQNAVYVRRQLKFYRATPKLNEDLLKEDTFRFSRIMHTNAKRLTADNIKSMSEYYAAEPCK